MSSFSVRFKDNERLTITDIIIFEQKQKEEVRLIASDYTKDELLNNEKYGKELSYLTDTQKLTVVGTKDLIVSGISSKELFNKDIVQVAWHFNKRAAERIGSDDYKTIISLIDCLKTTDSVLKAQFKGYPSLSYTMIKNGDPTHSKYPISFLVRRDGNHRIKMITLSPKTSHSKSEPMERRIAEDNEDLIKMFAEMKARLKKD